MQKKYSILPAFRLYAASWLAVRCSAGAGCGVRGSSNVAVVSLLRAALPRRRGEGGSTTPTSWWTAVAESLSSLFDSGDW